MPSHLLAGERALNVLASTVLPAEHHCAWLGTAERSTFVPNARNAQSFPTFDGTCLDSVTCVSDQSWQSRFGSVGINTFLNG